MRHIGELTTVKGDYQAGGDIQGLLWGRSLPARRIYHGWMLLYGGVFLLSILFFMLRVSRTPAVSVHACLWPLPRLVVYE